MDAVEVRQSIRTRLLALDALRGIIIVVMALDHANHFVARKHSSGEYWGGPFPSYPDALSFLTRFVTHLSAPGFFFLMGTGLLLFARSRRRQGWRQRDIVRHFVIRGGLLIGLQLLIVNRAWELSGGGWALNIYIGVLFALGGTMVLGSLLLWLPKRMLLALTIVLVLGTELLAPDPARWNQPFTLASRLLLAPGGDLDLWVNYPVLPWLELVTFGMVFGHWLSEDSRKAFNRALWLGIGFVVLFIVLRVIDGFGNIRPRPGNTWIDFLNVVKYPPSIVFTLLTMGTNLILLGLFARATRLWKWSLRPLVVFGQAPLFFYVAHLFLYAGLGLWLAPDGMSIPRMYPFWLLGLAILAPLTLGYGLLKSRQPANSLLRFF